MERAENFPVALHILPLRYRAKLRAVYDVVRCIDELGDAANGDRTVALEAFRDDLGRTWSGARPAADVLRRFAARGGPAGLPVEPFERLVEANLQDQVVSRYETFGDLLGYCALSAEPIGRIVLCIFGVDSPETAGLSDRVCTALQLLEHWQDVAEDRRAGRVYLPQEDLRAFGVPESDLDRPFAPDRLRRLIAVETERAEEMLSASAVLLPMLHGWARVAVTGYAAGGYAAAQALRRCRGDVISRRASARRVDVLRHAGRLARGWAA
jgi:squalene synthase HpnC